MRPRALVSLAAVAALLLSARWASAEGDPGAHLRVGMAFEGGPFIVPGFLTAAFVAAQGAGGVQFTNSLGLYVELGLGRTFATDSAPFYSGALLVEFTFPRLISIAVGPEVDNYDVRRTIFSSDPEPPIYLYGGKLRFAWHLVTWGQTASSRTDSYRQLVMLDLDLDVRLLRAPAGFKWEPNPAGIASAASFAIVPTLNFGLVFR